MIAASRNGVAQLTRLTPQDFGAYAGQILVTIVVALALGLAVALDAYIAFGLLGSTVAALALGVSFIHRRFDTLIAIWLFFMLQPLLVAAVGEGSEAGYLMNVVDVPILLVIGVVGLFLATREHGAVVRWLLVAGGVVLVSGLASDFAAGAPAYQSVVGAALRIKLFLLLGAGLAVRWTPALARKALRVIVVVAIVAAVAGILDFVSGGALRGIFTGHPTKPPRIGYVAAGGLFANVAVLSTFMVIAFTIILGMAWQGTEARRVPQLLLVSLAALFTLRFKAVVSIPAAVAALALTSKRVRSRLLLVVASGVLALVALTMVTGNDLATGVVNEQVGRYTSETEQPRERLQTVSIEIARDEFPLGVGFGRYGSPPSVQRGSYSPVYEQYGLTKYYGFSPSDLPIHFAIDTSWPGLLGEVGVLGFLAFALTVFVPIGMLFRRAREGGVQGEFASIGFAVMVVLVVDSLARPTLFDSFSLLTVVLVIVPGLWLASDRVPGASATEAGKPRGG